MPPPFAASDVATAAYCGRKAYLARDEDGGAPPPTVEAVRELAYRYPALVEHPEATVATVAEARSTTLDGLEPASIAGALARLRGSSLWDAVARPWREETVLRTDRLVGRLDKIVRFPAEVDGSDEGGGGEPQPAPSLVATGRPPTDGVWRAQRVRCAALVALLDGNGYDAGDRVVVEYPRVGAIRPARIRRRDERALADAIDTLATAERGHPPSRTTNPSKCNACRFREQCGVPTRSLASRLADRVGLGDDA